MSPFKGALELLLPQGHCKNCGTRPNVRSVIVIVVACFSLMSLLYCNGVQILNTRFIALDGSIDKLSQCTVDRLHRNTTFLDDIRPIGYVEFIERRNKLAKALTTSDADAFVLEPGYTFQYYGNVSQIDWEPWEPEERPFLMIVRAQRDRQTGSMTAKTSYLAPRFEEERVRMLGIPSNEELDILTWEEHWNPYTTLRNRLFNDSKDLTLMIDEELRDYIVRGLQNAGFHTVGLTTHVEAMREVKSSAEIDILRAVNTGTVESIRAMRPCIVPGLTERQVTMILNNALSSLGFQLFFNIVLFDENAASPHGGYDGSKVLRADTMVLIDVGAHYLGYSSDVCRSFFIGEHPNWLPQGLRLLLQALGFFRPFSRSPNYFQKLAVWDIVLQAQAAAREQLKPNHTAASVDIAARSVITNATYGEYFTHRVGHGIGIKAHESPYLNKGNNGTKLWSGMTFTNEPGIYLPLKFGVRHEDVYLVKENGEAENLSGGEAKSPWKP